MKNKWSRWLGGMLVCLFVFSFVRPAMAQNGFAEYAVSWKTTGVGRIGYLENNGVLSFFNPSTGAFTPFGVNFDDVDAFGDVSCGITSSTVPVPLASWNKVFCNDLSLHKDMWIEAPTRATPVPGSFFSSEAIEVGGEFLAVLENDIAAPTVFFHKPGRLWVEDLSIPGTQWFEPYPGNINYRAIGAAASVVCGVQGDTPTIGQVTVDCFDIPHGVSLGSYTTAGVLSDMANRALAVNEKTFTLVLSGSEVRTVDYRSGIMVVRSSWSAPAVYGTEISEVSASGNTVCFGLNFGLFWGKTIACKGGIAGTWWSTPYGILTVSTDLFGTDHIVLEDATHTPIWF